MQRVLCAAVCGQRVRKGRGGVQRALMHMKEKYLLQVCVTAILAMSLLIKCRC